MQGRAGLGAAKLRLRTSKRGVYSGSLRTQDRIPRLQNLAERIMFRRFCAVLLFTALMVAAAPGLRRERNPIPGITSLSPSSTTAGAAAQTLAINGTNFLTTSTVTYNAVAHTA